MRSESVLLESEQLMRLREQWQLQERGQLPRRANHRLHYRLLELCRGAERVCLSHDVLRLPGREGVWHAIRTMHILVPVGAVLMSALPVELWLTGILLGLITGRLNAGSA
jgi:hypothetical protein